MMNSSRGKPGRKRQTPYPNVPNEAEAVDSKNVVHVHSVDLGGIENKNKKKPYYLAKKQNAEDEDAADHAPVQTYNNNRQHHVKQDKKIVE